jgi:proton-translocating NADH-quinone oxidoreductase chain L
MTTAILALPLFSAISAGSVGRLFGRFGAMVVTTANMWLARAIAFCVAVRAVSGNHVSEHALGQWIRSENLSIEWLFQADSLTAVMLVVVTTVAALVHTYSMFYMKDDPSAPRFFTYLSLFAFFMLILITSGNLIILFTGWEGVGLCSYLLINFWYTRLQANKAAMKAIVVNRIGDFCFVIGITLIYKVCHTVGFTSVFPALAQLTGELAYIDLLCLFLFLGAVGKSAQLGLHTWLPDAMEGPTPVSALIHAATMVTAGIFLVIRCSSIFELTHWALFLVGVVGVGTAFFAASVGLVQNDIKRVIAYSTCSQLGYMAFVCGLSNYSASLFHLFNHAFFKALLFLTAGSVIHALVNQQDLRRMGGMARLTPLFYMMTLLGSLALIGFPFYAGFYSKDFILEIAASTYTVSGLYLYWLGTLSAMFTAFYSTRLLYMGFVSRFNGPRLQIEGVHGSTVIENVVFTVLVLGALFSGYFCKDLFIGLGTDFFKSAMAVGPNNYYGDAEFLPYWIKNLPTAFSLASAGVAWVMVGGWGYFEVTLRHYPVFHLLSSKWYFNYIQNTFVSLSVLELGHKTFWLWDRLLLEQIRLPRCLSE